MLKHLLLVALVACTTGESAPTPTADAPAALTNVPFGGTCTITSDTSTECTTGVCTDSFDMLGHDVCSVKCTMLGGTDPTCPMGPSMQKCNGKGYCKP